jgi:cobalt/nickel transport protein
MENAMHRIWLALVPLTAWATTSFAHYNMLIPDKAWTNKGEKVTFTYQFGHPFEHELFDAPQPLAVIVILPDGKTQAVKSLAKEALKGIDGKKVAGYRFAYEPQMRGDHTVMLQTPPVWMEESKDFVQDTVKVVLHVQTQKNWDTGLPLELFDQVKFRITPLTRPYGLYPGMTFQAHAGLRPSKKGGGGGGKLVEIERYNSQPPEKLPPDELITFKTKTDPNGVFTFAFPEAGWWSMTGAFQEKDLRWKDGGKEGPLRERATLWVHVNEKK